MDHIITLVRVIIRRGTIGGLAVTPIILIRTGVIGTGGTITGTTIELRFPIDLLTTLASA